MLKEQSLVNIFKKRTRHLLRPRASDIINRLFPDFEPFEVPSKSLIAGKCTFLEKNIYTHNVLTPQIIKCT